MVHLTREEEEMLAGKHGEAKRLSMELLVKAAEAYKAEKLIPINSCHLVLSFQKTALTAGLEIAERFVKLGAKCAVPTSIDTSSMDFERWKEFRFPEDFMEDQFRMKKALEGLGAIPTWTCVPYQGGGIVPRFGEHIAWTESSTAPYVNGLIGARTNRVGAYEDLASAITGRTPYYGLHLDENRLGNILIEVKTDLTPGDYNVFGSWLGELVETKIPVITGIPDNVRSLDLRYFGAAAAATGSLALYHMPGITAEAKTVQEAFGGKEIPERVQFGPEELKKRKREMSSVPGGKIDLVVIGCPHLTIEGLIDLAERAKGKKVKVETYALTNKVSKDIAIEMGVAQIIEEAGIKLNTGCCAWSPVELCGFPEHFTVMANSGKQAWYIPSLLTQMRPGKVDVIYGDVDECIEAACKGEFEERREVVKVAAKVLKGRALSGGIVEGEAIVSKMMFNWAGAFNPVTGEIIDPRHDCSGMKLKDKIFIYSYSRGSTTNPAIFMEGIRNKVNPIALVMLEMEPMTLIGVASGAIFYNVKIPVVDKTDINPIDVIKTGDKVRVNGDTGIVEVLR